MLIEAYGCLILLIYRNLINTEVIKAILNKPTADTHTHIQWCYKEHLQPTILNTHKGDSLVAYILNNHQLLNAT